MESTYCVIVIFEAKKGKEKIVKEELLKIMELNRQDSTCLDYRVHEDVNNPAQFVLYENWKSKEDHSKQLQKPYIIDFGKKLEDLLNKPYQRVIAKKL